MACPRGHRVPINSVITRYGDRFEYASPEETPALMSDLVNWYNDAEKLGRFTPSVRGMEENPE